MLVNSKVAAVAIAAPCLTLSMGRAIAQTAPAPKTKVASSVAAGKSFAHSAGWGFTSPQNWTVAVGADGKFKLAPPNADAENEAYAFDYTPDPKIADVSGTAFVVAMDAEMKRLLPNLRRTEEPVRLSTPLGAAMILTWNADLPNNTALRVRVYAAPFGGGAISLVAMGTPANLDKSDAQLRTVFASLRREAPPKDAADTPIVKAWRERITGKKLTRLESYNSSGGAGGYSSRTDIVLRADRRFTFASDSSVSMSAGGASGGSSGTKKAEGKWRVTSRGTQTVLALQTEGRPEEFFVLTADAEKTFLNGNRWFVTAP